MPVSKSKLYMPIRLADTQLAKRGYVSGTAKVRSCGFVVFITEAPDEKAAMAVLVQFGGDIATETLITIPREEALKLMQ